MTIEKPPEQYLTELPQIVEEGLKYFMMLWHEETAPKHFRQAAPDKWHYDKRSSKYQKVKERWHLQPLMWTGESRRRLLNSIRIMMTGKSPVKATGSFDAPQYFWMSNNHDMGGEFMRVNPDEANALAQNLNEYTVQQFDELKGIKEEIKY